MVRAGNPPESVPALLDAASLKQTREARATSSSMPLLLFDDGELAVHRAHILHAREPDGYFPQEDREGRRQPLPRRDESVRRRAEQLPSLHALTQAFVPG